MFKLKRFLSENQWLLIALAWMVTYWLGWTGVTGQFQATGEVRSWWDPFYRTFQLFFFDDSMVVSGPVLAWQLEIARFLAPAVAAYTAFVALFTLFRDQAEMFRLRLMRRHVVVCGIGRKGMGLVRDYHSQGRKIVVIENDNENDFIEVCRDLNVLVLIGDATDESLLRRARVHQAEKVVALTGNDGTNVEIAVRTYQLVQNEGDRVTRPVKCFVQVADAKLRILFGRHPLFTEVSDPFEVSVFNTYANSARLLFERFPPDRSGISENDETELHYFIAGFGQMGESILLQAARIGHFANGKKISVTVVDRQADIKSKIFREHYPQINEIIVPDFITADAEDPDLLEIIKQRSNRAYQWSTVIIALDDDARALSCALGFLLKLENPEIPIIVRMSEKTGLAVLLQNEAASSSWMSTIHPFGMSGDLCTGKVLMDEKLDVFARKIHQDFVEKRIKEGRSPLDPGLAPWERLNPDLKDSNRHQADHMSIKLKALGCEIFPGVIDSSEFDGFTVEETELLARMEHNRWMAERLLAGWICGPKAEGKRQSPFLVDWNDLPEPIREYDRETVRNIPEIVATVGNRVVRSNLKKQN